MGIPASLFGCADLKPRFSVIACLNYRLIWWDLSVESPVPCPHNSISVTVNSFPSWATAMWPLYLSMARLTLPKAEAVFPPGLARGGQAVRGRAAYDGFRRRVFDSVVEDVFRLDVQDLAVVLYVQ